MLGRDEDDIVRGAGHGEIRKVERLRVDQSVHHEIAQLSEGRGSYVGRRKSRLGKILSGAHDIVLVGHHIGARGAGVTVAVTVSVAALLVMLPVELVTTTVKLDPLSPLAAAGVV